MKIFTLFVCTQIAWMRVCVWLLCSKYKQKDGDEERRKKKLQFFSVLFALCIKNQANKPLFCMCICMKTIFLWHQCAGLFYMSLFSLFFFFSLSAYVLKLYYTNKLPINLTKISQKKYIFISSTCLFSMNNYVGFSLSSCILLHIFRWHHLSICIHQYSDFKAKKNPKRIRFWFHRFIGDKHHRMYHYVSVWPMSKYRTNETD